MYNCCCYCVVHNFCAVEFFLFSVSIVSVCSLFYILCFIESLWKTLLYRFILLFASNQCTSGLCSLLLLFSAIFSLSLPRSLFFISHFFRDKKILLCISMYILTTCSFSEHVNMCNSWITLEWCWMFVIFFR